MLVEFSRRALAHITGLSHGPLQVPFLSAYLDANIMKEVEKDRIIIGQAASAFEMNIGLDRLDIDDIFERTKIVDKAFVKSLLIPSLAVNVRYEDITDIRKNRIRCLSRAVFALLKNWADSVSFETRLRESYPEQDFKTMMAEILHWYNQETRLLSNSIKFLHPFNVAINLFAETVFESMEEAAEELTADCATRIYRVKNHG